MFSSENDLQSGSPEALAERGRASVLTMTKLCYRHRVGGQVAASRRSTLVAA